MMFGDWRQRLLALRDRLFGEHSATDPLEEVEIPTDEVAPPGPSELPAERLPLPTEVLSSVSRTSGQVPDQPYDPASKKSKADRKEKTVDSRPKNGRRSAQKPTPVANVKRLVVGAGRAAKHLVAEHNEKRGGDGLRQHDARSTGRDQVFLNLGIDFGTSFTKVCFRDVGTEDSFLVTFDAISAHDALLPSIVAVDKKGTLYTADQAPRGAVLVPYLKMRLAGSPIGEDLPVVDGVDLGSREATCALASWFLARVLSRSQEWIRKHERDRLKNRIPVWSANIGVPVEHYDSVAIDTFRRVLGTSWIWVANARLPKTVGEAVSAYRRDVDRLEGEVSDFHAVPEIAAAVQSFVMSREAVAGIYVYFDIGGGTVDGVAFKFLNHHGERRVNFYSGKVSPLGISALASALGSGSPRDIDEKKLKRLISNGNFEVLGGFEHRVRQLVGEVVITAKRKDGRNWQEDAIQDQDARKTIRHLGGLDRKKMAPLVVFLGGGGAPSAWYQTAISSTYDKFQHFANQIPPYQLVEVAAPRDLDMKGLASSDFRRFAISYGLSIPFGEGPEVGLPSQFANAEPLPVRQNRVADYLDSKDAYD
ncbi:hypothetical protein [Mesorhizobium sp.]|uniref:hypothetical protein n=1 Tax=Mesorhizobium sp. TaxID=1871066 RepID=UPI000FE80298|nr:hypothetical protein [Mesorhizobium sp.]RWE54184.1 MAG: hypothetical protein EOS67_26225 [Mesorhizobium sp.]